MAEYDNTNRGTLGKNQRKSKDTDADLSGQINIEGREYWLSGWRKENKRDGSTFYSLSVKPKEPRQGISQGGRSHREAPPVDFSDLRGGDDDTIPF